MYIEYNIPSDEIIRSVINAWLTFANENYTDVEEIKSTPGWKISDECLAAIKSEYINTLIYKKNKENGKDI